MDNNDIFTGTKVPRDSTVDFTETVVIDRREFIETLVINKDEVAEIDLQQQMAHAKKIHEQIRSYLDQLYLDVNKTDTVDTNKAKEVVSNLVTNILATPDTSEWLTHIKNRDEAIALHSVNVCIHAINFGRFLGLSEDELNNLGLGALLHDIGKIKIPMNLLRKTGKLSKEECSLFKAHPFLGYELLKEQDDLPIEALDIVREHHERFDGQGYPSAKKGDQISYYARIVALVDVFDAMTSDFPYHDGINIQSALTELYKNSAGQFDPKLLEAFIQYMGTYPVGSIVELSTGHTAVVIKNNKSRPLKPVIGLVLNRHNEPYKEIRLINLDNDFVQNGKPHKVEITHILEPDAHDIDVPAVLLNVITTH